MVPIGFRVERRSELWGKAVDSCRHSGIVAAGVQISNLVGASWNLPTAVITLLLALVVAEIWGRWAPVPSRRWEAKDWLPVAGVAAGAVAKALYALTYNERLKQILAARAEDQWELWDLLNLLASAGFNPRRLWKAQPGDRQHLCSIVPPESLNA